MSDTQQMLDQQINAAMSNAGEIWDHVENFDEHAREMAAGERETDEYMDTDTEDASELADRWREGILSIERRVTFEFWLTFGGPNVWAEVQTTADKRSGWTAYDIRHITLHGRWGSDKSTRIVHESDALWKLIEQEVESMGEYDGWPCTTTD